MHNCQVWYQVILPSCLILFLTNHAVWNTQRQITISGSIMSDDNRLRMKGLSHFSELPTWTSREFPISTIAGCRKKMCVELSRNGFDSLSLWYRGRVLVEYRQIVYLIMTESFLDLHTVHIDSSIPSFLTSHWDGVSSEGDSSSTGDSSSCWRSRIFKARNCGCPNVYSGDCAISRDSWAMDDPSRISLNWLSRTQCCRFMKACCLSGLQFSPIPPCCTGSFALTSDTLCADPNTNAFTGWDTFAFCKDVRGTLKSWCWSLGIM